MDIENKHAIIYYLVEDILLHDTIIYDFKTYEATYKNKKKIYLLTKKKKMVTVVPVIPKLEIP